jgi:hypothetical protein
MSDDFSLWDTETVESGSASSFNARKSFTATYKSETAYSIKSRETERPLGDVSLVVKYVCKTGLGVPTSKSITIYPVLERSRESSRRNRELRSLEVELPCQKHAESKIEAAAGIIWSMFEAIEGGRKNDDEPLVDGTNDSNYEPPTLSWIRDALRPNGDRKKLTGEAREDLFRYWFMHDRYNYYTQALDFLARRDQDGHPGIAKDDESRQSTAGSLTQKSD